VIRLGVADSSAYIALERIGRLDILRASFEQLLFPPTVLEEIGELPDWAGIASLERDAGRIFPTQIHKGEAEVILFGLQHREAVLLLDDYYARVLAQRNGLTVIGLVGLILRAKRVGLIDNAMSLLHLLVESGFRLSAQVLAEAQKLAGE
jgi:uncharacterized protein